MARFFRFGAGAPPPGPSHGKTHPRPNGNAIRSRGQPPSAAHQTDSYHRNGRSNGNGSPFPYPDEAAIGVAPDIHVKNAPEQEYDPVRSYNAEIEHALIEDERNDVNDALAGYTNPYVDRMIRLIWLGSGAVLWVSLWGLCVAILHNMGVMAYAQRQLGVPLMWFLAPVILGPPLVVLALLLFQRLVSLRFGLRYLAYDLQIYADDEVGRRLELDRNRNIGLLRSNDPESVSALYELLQLRLRGFRIWRRFHVHPFALRFSLNAQLKLPFFTPRFVMISAPVTMLFCVVIFNLGMAAGRGDFAAGWAGAWVYMPVVLFKAVLGLRGDQALSAFPWTDALVVMVGLAVGVSAYLLARHIREYILTHLQAFLNTEAFMLPFTHDCSNEILRRYNYVREEMIKGYRRHYADSRDDYETHRNRDHQSMGQGEWEESRRNGQNVDGYDHDSWPPGDQSDDRATDRAAHDNNDLEGQLSVECDMTPPAHGRE